MGRIELVLKEEPAVPLEAEVISPGVLAGKSRAEIGRLPVYLGRQQASLEDFFEITGEGGTEVYVRGNLSMVKHMGRGMSAGRLHIAGDAGMHLGAGMSGGAIVVDGDAGDWLGAEMRGGSIRVRGRAGHLVGAAYRGNDTGMNGGLIVIEGGAGDMVGEHMRRGVIVVYREAGDFAGAMMRGGTLVLAGPAGEAPGAGMRRGSIVALHPCSLLPTFKYAAAFQPVFLRLLYRWLAQQGVKIPGEKAEAVYRRYCGDMAETGKGEILIWHGNN
ncbi:hypothetical protein SY88_21005 [Clostridiales bacterium PH28_bin88]|nr:hypothetical protein SY88_21005 [Clostridiales bacterium PH28_bin88]